MAHNTQSLSTRLGVVDLEAVRRIAQSQGLSLSAYTRKAIVLFSTSAPGDVGARRNVCAALQIPPTATDEEILHAVEAVLGVTAADADPAPTDPLADAADKVSPVAALSAVELAAANGFKDSAKKAKFLELRAQRARERLEQTKPPKK